MQRRLLTWWVWPSAALAVVLLSVWSDRRWGWLTFAFDFVAHQFYEIPMLAAIRRPSQLALVRAHALVLAGFVIAYLTVRPGLNPHARRFGSILCVAYTLRALIWICGANLPLVPGDSCHYVEVATSIYHGEGPVKHYVESYFRDYPEIRRGAGILDDWATPLYSYILAAGYRLVRIVPGESLEATFGVAKGTSFVLNMLTLPFLYLFARRRFGLEAGLLAMGLLAVLPVHVLYAGMELRESLVALSTVLAVWLLTEIPRTRGGLSWSVAIAGGLCAGLAILARNTALALVAAIGLCALWTHGKKHLLKLLLWGGVALLVIAPWAWATYLRYGTPFYTYTQYFQYTFSWTVHHYQEGFPRAADFYTWRNAPDIVRVKIKSLFIIVVYSTMIMSLPLGVCILRRLRRPGSDSTPDGREVDRMVAVVGSTFVVATLWRIADITQVAQLGRYYLPLFVLFLPTAAAGLRDWYIQSQWSKESARLFAMTLIVLLWSDPTWAYDYTWLTKPYQLHWQALRSAGDWVKAHPQDVPDDARILTWFPWEFRVASGRTTVLFPRSFYPSVGMQSRRIDRAIEQYGVTHVLWGSFETPPQEDPETFGPYLQSVRTTTLLGATELFKSSPRYPYPVRLYRLRGGGR